jgi:hypothetical protein
VGRPLLPAALAILVFVAPAGAGEGGDAPKGPAVPPGNDGAGGSGEKYFGGRRQNPRQDPSRSESLRAEGGEGTEKAVAAGLEWLKRHRTPEGWWDSDGFEKSCRNGKCGGPGGPLYDPGVTGLALLAFLGCGETHKTTRYGPVVRDGLKYLKGIQDDEGCFGPRTSGHFTYNHAIATLAFVDAYGMTQSPLFKEPAQSGVEFILQCQNPYLGWRYGVRPKDNDTSVTGWMVAALHAARSAGLTVDPATFEGARAWLDKVTDPDTGRTGYTNRDNGPARPKELMTAFPAEKSESLTAMAVLARLECGAAVDDPRVAKGVALCLRRPPRWDESDGSIDFYYWYAGTMSVFQVGGEPWKKWNEAMKRALLDSQRRETAYDLAGSWDPVDPWGVDGGRVYSTALAILTLETYYRYPRWAPTKAK